MDPSGPWPWIVLVLLIIVGSFFGASETALTSVNRIKIKVKADDGSKAAQVVLKILDRIDSAVVTILILNNLVQVAMSTVATLLAIHLFSQAGIVNSEGLGSLVATIIISLIVFLICDSIPKSIARLKPEAVTLFVGYIIYGLMILIFPISIIFEGLNKFLSKVFKIKEGADPLTEQDLSNVVESIEEQGILPSEGRELIDSAIIFDRTHVSDVMTPRANIKGVDITGLDHEKLQAIALDSAYSRLPVYRGDLDHIIGTLSIRSYLRACLINPDLPIREQLIKPYYVKADTLLDDILTGFKLNHTHMAFVVDDHKHVIGMITMEDVLEELVGETDEKTIYALGDRD